jgi:hypothetical protein
VPRYGKTTGTGISRATVQVRAAFDIRRSGRDASSLCASGGHEGPCPYEAGVRWGASCEIGHAGRDGDLTVRKNAPATTLPLQQPGSAHSDLPSNPVFLQPTGRERLPARQPARLASSSSAVLPVLCVSVVYFALRLRAHGVRVWDWDGCIARQPGYWLGQGIRKSVEENFGSIKTAGAYGGAGIGVATGHKRGATLWWVPPIYRGS